MSFKKIAFNSNDIADIELSDNLKTLRAYNIGLDIELDLGPLALQIHKAGLSMFAVGHDAAGQNDFFAFFERCQNVFDVLRNVEFSPVRIDAFIFKLVELFNPNIFDFIDFHAERLLDYYYYYL